VKQSLQPHPDKTDPLLLTNSSSTGHPFEPAQPTAQTTVEGVRIAIVAESFLPLMNGVTHSILRVLEHLQERGDEVMVIAPSTSDTDVSSVEKGAYVHRLPSVPLAGYTNVRVALGGVNRVKRILADFSPDVVHLASPFVLGWRAVQAAHQLGIPTVAIYQTEVPSYAARYGVPFLENWAWNRVDNIHLLATRTLVPSTFALNQLRGRGILRVDMWRRGVDTARFNPAQRSTAWRSSVAPSGHRIIGYVGRLAVEKQVEDLAVLADLPNTKLVIVGDGPQRAALEAQLPDAHFAGFLGGVRWRRRLRVSIFSFIPASSRPSARPSRKPWRRASPWWQPAAAAPWTSWRTRAPVGFTNPGISPSCAVTCRT
jgi:phosphatidylinositol alpha 1,6-mannosyltransferase